jgi:hypothetical protein
MSEVLSSKGVTVVFEPGESEADQDVKDFAELSECNQEGVVEMKESLSHFDGKEAAKGMQGMRVVLRDSQKKVVGLGTYVGKFKKVGWLGTLTKPPGQSRDLPNVFFPAGNVPQKKKDGDIALIDVLCAKSKTGMGKALVLAMMDKAFQDGRKGIVSQGVTDAGKKVLADMGFEVGHLDKDSDIAFMGASLTPKVVKSAAATFSRSRAAAGARPPPSRSLSGGGARPSDSGRPGGSGRSSPASSGSPSGSGRLGGSGRSSPARSGGRVSSKTPGSTTVSDSERRRAEDVDEGVTSPARMSRGDLQRRPRAPRGLNKLTRTDVRKMWKAATGADSWKADVQLAKIKEENNKRDEKKRVTDEKLREWIPALMSKEVLMLRKKGVSEADIRTENGKRGKQIGVEKLNAWLARYKEGGRQGRAIGSSVNSWGGISKCPKPFKNILNNWACKAPCSLMRKVKGKRFCARRTGSGSDLDRRKRLQELILQIESSSGFSDKRTLLAFNEAVEIMRKMMRIANRSVVKGYGAVEKQSVSNNIQALKGVSFSDVAEPTRAELVAFKNQKAGKVKDIKEQITELERLGDDDSLKKVRRLKMKLWPLRKEISLVNETLGQTR